MLSQLRWLLFKPCCHFMFHSCLPLLPTSLLRLCSFSLSAGVWGRNGGYVHNVGDVRWGIVIFLHKFSFFVNQTNGKWYFTIYSKYGSIIWLSLVKLGYHCSMSSALMLPVHLFNQWVVMMLPLFCLSVCLSCVYITSIHLSVSRHTLTLSSSI